MTVSAWRIVKRRLAREAFSGEGARLYGGRWNSPGVLVVYTAQSQSLAALEMLVHLENPDVLAEYVVIEARFAEPLITRVPRANLPDDWRANPAPASARDRRCVDRGRTVGGAGAAERDYSG